MRALTKLALGLMGGCGRSRPAQTVGYPKREG